MQRFLFNLRIASEALMQNKVRSFLTALGIIFGVASVIAMQAIGRGTQQKILDQMKLVGVNNIVIEHKAPDPRETKDEEPSGNMKKEPASLGLSLADGESIKAIPMVTRLSPETIYEVFAIRNGRGKTASLIGVDPNYFSIMGLSLEQGRSFTPQELEDGDAVCVITNDVKNQFFGGENPIGKSLKCGKLWLKVVGVLTGRKVSEEDASSLRITASKLNVYAPVSTVLLRHENRSLLTKARVEAGNNRFFFNDDDDGQQEQEKTEYQQVDKFIVQVAESDYVQKVENVIIRMLHRRHNGAEDFTTTVPEVLLQQKKETSDDFNRVLAVIAAISLLVGGIGIMNIMLVSVVERMKEIGIRQALGATRSDIVAQFLAEATLISISGGFAGIILGIAISEAIPRFREEIVTVLTLSPILLSFLISVIVGLIFGVAPARKAALQDPVESLRHE